MVNNCQKGQGLPKPFYFLVSFCKTKAVLEFGLGQYKNISCKLDPIIFLKIPRKQQQFLPSLSSIVHFSTSIGDLVVAWIIRILFQNHFDSIALKSFTLWSYRDSCLNQKCLVILKDHVASEKGRINLQLLLFLQYCLFSGIYTNLADSESLVSFTRVSSKAQ